MKKESLWITQRDLLAQRLARALILTIGILFLYLTSNYGKASFQNNMFSAHILGWILTVLGTSSLIFSHSQTIVIDPNLKQIRIDNHNFIFAANKTILFKNIEKTSVGFIGKASNGYMRYHVVLHLKSGKRIPIFIGFYPDASNKYAVEQRAKKIEELIHNS